MPGGEIVQCPGCGASSSGEVHTTDCPTRRVVVTDKRGGKDRTAEEIAEQTEFVKQLAAEEKRLAEWDAMSDEQKQAILAQQAAEQESVPFQGAGMQAPPSEDAGKKSVLAMFTIVIHRDGTAVASDDYDLLSKFEPEFPVDADKIYRAVCEIKKDIESTSAATTTLMMMNQHAQHMQQQAQANALAAQLSQRGQQTPRGKRH